MNESEKPVAGAVAQLASAMYMDIAQPSARRIGPRGQVSNLNPTSGVALCKPSLSQTF
jgi:hypothetical protein